MTVDDAKGESAPDTARPGVSDHDFSALAPGRFIGRYEIVSILGQGGFGIT